MKLKVGEMDLSKLEKLYYMSADVQVLTEKNNKEAYDKASEKLIEMLELLAKNTRYERAVDEAIKAHLDCWYKLRNRCDYEV